MAEIDIFNLEPSKIDKSLKGKFILLYGAPKTGKSTFGSKLPRSLFMKFEDGTNALSGIRGVPILKWTDAKKVLTQLRKPQAKEMYDTIVVDTASIAYSLCETFICQQAGVTQIKEIPYGQGFGMVKQEFLEMWREIALLGFGILFIAHEKNYTTDEVNENGEEIVGVRPDLTNSCASIINSQVDIIAYLKTVMKPDGTTDRKLYTRSTPYIFAGSRYKYLEPVIPFGDDGYQALVDAIGAAIDEDIVRNDAQVVDSVDHVQIKSRSFDEIMSEAKELWVNYLNGAENDDDADYRLRILNDIIVKVFGKPIKLSTAVPSQADLVELVIDEMKELA